MSHGAAVERAIAALRTGRPVRIEASDPLTILSIETATPELLELLDPEAKAPLLLSGLRAAASRSLLRIRRRISLVRRSDR